MLRGESWRAKLVFWGIVAYAVGVFGAGMVTWATGG